MSKWSRDDGGRRLARACIVAEYGDVGVLEYLQRTSRADDGR
jgi:hypothetical protein